MSEGIIPTKMDIEIYEIFKKPGLYTLEKLPIRKEYKNDIILEEFVTIVDKFGIETFDC
jgi:hypothetical protein